MLQKIIHKPILEKTFLCSGEDPFRSLGWVQDATAIFQHFWLSNPSPASPVASKQIGNNPFNAHARCGMLPARHTPKQCWPSQMSAGPSWARCGQYGWPCWMRTSFRYVSMLLRRWGMWSALMGRKRSIRSCRSSGDLLPASCCHPVFEMFRKVRLQAWKCCFFFIIRDRTHYILAAQTHHTYVCMPQLPRVSWILRHGRDISSYSMCYLRLDNFGAGIY